MVRVVCPPSRGTQIIISEVKRYFNPDSFLKLNCFDMNENFRSMTHRCLRVFLKNLDVSPQGSSNGRASAHIEAAQL